MEYMAETGHFQKCLRILLPSLPDEDDNWVEFYDLIWTPIPLQYFLYFATSDPEFHCIKTERGWIAQ